MKVSLILFVVTWFICHSNMLAQDKEDQSREKRDSVVVKTYVACISPSSLKRDTSEGPPDYVRVDKQPKVIYFKKPECPPFARWDSTEGRTWVKVWVDKAGNPRKAILLKSTDEIYNLPSTDAAMACKFTPATLNNKPVDVWAVIPFTFDKRTNNAALDTLSGVARRLNEIVDNLELSSKLWGAPKIDSASYASAVSGYLKALRIYVEYKDWPNSYSRYAKSLLQTAERNLKIEENDIEKHK